MPNRDQFPRHWKLNSFERPENLAYELAPYALTILMDRERMREADTGKLITTVDKLLASRSLHLEGYSDEPLLRSKTQHGASVAMTIAALRSRLNTAAAANNLQPRQCPTFDATLRNTSWQWSSVTA